MTLLLKRPGAFYHWCPACEQMHPLPDTWSFNGDIDRPTFAPSFKHTLVHWSDGIGEDGIGRGERSTRVCHYLIVHGEIQFCIDSWHGRSDIVALLPAPAQFREAF